MVELIDDFFAEYPPAPGGSDKVVRGQFGNGLRDRLNDFVRLLYRRESTDLSECPLVGKHTSGSAKPLMVLGATSSPALLGGPRARRRVEGVNCAGNLNFLARSHQDGIFLQYLIATITYKSAMDDPNRIAKSKSAGALFGLTPKKYQSGEKDVTVLRRGTCRRC